MEEVKYPERGDEILKWAQAVHFKIHDKRSGAEEKLYAKIGELIDKADSPDAAFTLARALGVLGDIQKEFE